jgi:TP901 family phage tail tape measure protein
MDGMSAGDVFVRFRTALTEFSTGLDMAVAKFSTSVNTMATKAEGLRTAGIMLAGLGVGAGAFIKKAIGEAASFESGMSRVNAVAGLSTKEFKKLSDAAKQIGVDTSYTAQEVATSMYKAASAGVQGSKGIEQVTRAVTYLGEASQKVVDLDTGTQTLMATLNGFNIPMTEAVSVTDKFAKAVNTSALEMVDITQGMPVLTARARSANQSIDDMIAAMEAMAKAGLHGREATHGISSALRVFQVPTQQAAKLIQNLGIEFRDAEGNMKRWPDLVDELQKKLDPAWIRKSQSALELLGQRMGSSAAKGEKWKDALKASDKALRDYSIQIIAGQAGFQAINASMQAGTDQLRQWSDALKTSEGAAKDMSKAMLANLSGAMERMRGSISTVMIAIGEQLIPAMTALAVAGEKFANWLNSLPDWAKKGFAWTTATIAVLGTLGGAMLLLASLAGQMATGFRILSGVITWTNLQLQTTTVSVAALRTTIASSGGLMGAVKGLGGLLGWLGPVAAAAFAGWGIGRLIGELTGLDRMVGNVAQHLMALSKGTSIGQMKMETLSNLNQVNIALDDIRDSSRDLDQIRILPNQPNSGRVMRERKQSSGAYLL